MTFKRGHSQNFNLTLEDRLITLASWTTKWSMDPNSTSNDITLATLFGAYSKCELHVESPN